MCLVALHAHCTIDVLLFFVGHKHSMSTRNSKEKESSALVRGNAYTLIRLQQVDFSTFLIDIAQLHESNLIGSDFLSRFIYLALNVWILTLWLVNNFVHFRKPIDAREKAKPNNPNTNIRTRTVSIERTQTSTS